VGSFYSTHFSIYACPQAFISADPEGGAMTSRATVAQRAKFSSDWIGKPKKPLMRDNSGPLPKLQFKNLRDLYQTDGVMQPPKDAPTIYHARMHDMVTKQILPCKRLRRYYYDLLRNGDLFLLIIIFSYCFV
jgi:hypothetical protein